MNFYQTLSSKDILHNFDEHLQMFYNRVLMREMDMKNPQNILRIRKALKVVVNAYKKKTVQSLSSSILFDTQEKRCAYVLKHCTCFTSAVARHFLSFLQSNPTVLSRVFQQRQLNLCCLGGGPATDAVAVAKVINSLNCFFTSGLEFNISVVDLSMHWQPTAAKVVHTLEDTPEFCCRDRFRVHFQFLQADLTDACPKTVTDVLSAADVITMVYFVSAVNGSKNAKRCGTMLKKIMQGIKPGAALFFLDSSKDIQYNSFRSAAHSVKDLERVYGPYAMEFHRLSMKSIDRFMDLYSCRFDVYMCLTNCFTTCAAWIKGATPACRPNFLLCGNCGVTDEESPNARRKKAAYRTIKQCLFRQRLEKRFAPLKFECGEQDIENPDEEYEAELWERGEQLLHLVEVRKRKMSSMLVQKQFLWSRIRVSGCCERAKARYRSSDIVEIVNSHASFDQSDYSDVCSEKMSRVTKWTRRKGLHVT